MNAKILAYIIAEVGRQGHNPEAEEGAQRVLWMQYAWEDAIEHRSKPLNRGRILRLAHYIEPLENSVWDYRTCNVRVGFYVAPRANEVLARMERWFEMLPSMTPEEAYRELMEIHPWADGNGRTGKIVYNWLKGTLDNPVLPPNFFGCANP